MRVLLQAAMLVALLLLYVKGARELTVAEAFASRYLSVVTYEGASCAIVRAAEDYLSCRRVGTAQC